MEFKLENKYLVPAINFLQIIKLKGADSRARSKMIKLLKVSVKELEESELDLLEEYGVKDENGELQRDSSGVNYSLIAATASKYHQEHDILLNEVVEIKGGTYVNHIGNVLDILNNYDEELEGQNAEVYDVLLDAMEFAKEEQEYGS